jgi:hypothetical protein
VPVGLALGAPLAPNPVAAASAGRTPAQAQARAALPQARRAQVAPVRARARPGRPRTAQTTVAQGS